MLHRSNTTLLRDLSRHSLNCLEGGGCRHEADAHLVAVQQGCRLINSEMLRNELLWAGCRTPESSLNMEYGQNNVSESSIYSTAVDCAGCAGCIISAMCKNE